MKIRRTVARLTAAYLPGQHRRCPCCDQSVHHFLPYRNEEVALMSAVDCVGSRIDQFWCPRCMAHDRERHLLLYLRALGLLDQCRGKHVLHFAPERRLRAHILAAGPARYVFADLYPAQPGIERVDVQHMPFDPQTFDVVIANHIMEHVQDDRQALREITRVLRDGGFAILQTPYSPLLEHTWQDDGIKSESGRLQAYGQEDHVRLFGQDIFKRFASTGLETHIVRHAECLANIDADTFGVNEAEPLFLFKKPPAHSAITEQTS